MGKFLLAICFCTTITLPTLSSAQGPPQQPPSVQVRPQAMISEQDGGVDQVLQSIVIPPMPNAPFSLTL